MTPDPGAYFSRTCEHGHVRSRVSKKRMTPYLRREDDLRGLSGHMTPSVSTEPMGERGSVKRFPHRAVVSTNPTAALAPTSLGRGLSPTRLGELPCPEGPVK